MVELRWCGEVRVYIRKKPADGIVALEVAIFSGKQKRSRLALLQAYHGLKPNKAGLESAGRAALVALMSSTPAGVDLTGIAWQGPPDGFELVEHDVSGGVRRELVWSDLEALGRKGWDVA